VFIAALLDEEHKIIMDWSAKAGSVLAVTMFFRHMGVLEEAMRYDRWVHRYRTKVFMRKHRVHDAHLEDGAYFKFKIVRNPYSRAVSSYIFAMRTGYADEEIRTVLHKEPYDMSFADYVAFLKATDIATCNIHHRRQKKEYEFQSAGVFDFVCRLERIEPDIETVNRMSGAGFSLHGLIRRSEHHAPIESGIEVNISNVPWSEIMKRGIPAYRNFYNPGLKRAVRSIYHDDIDTYGYRYDLDREET